MTPHGWGPFPAGKHEQLKPVTIREWAGEGIEPPVPLKVTSLQRADNTSPAEILFGPLGSLVGLFGKQMVGNVVPAK